MYQLLLHHYDAIIHYCTGNFRENPKNPVFYKNSQIRYFGRQKNCHMTQDGIVLQSNTVHITQEYRDITSSQFIYMSMTRLQSEFNSKLV